MSSSSCGCSSGPFDQSAVGGASGSSRSSDRSFQRPLRAARPSRHFAAVQAGIQVGDQLRLFALGQVVSQQAKQAIRSGAGRHVESPGEA